MKLKEYCKWSRDRLLKVMVENGKKNGFKKGKEHPKWHGGIKHGVDGYISVRIYPDNPFYKMTTWGYVKRGRLMMAKKTGRCLKASEIIHHCNGIRDDDRIENLMLLKNHREHATLHHRLRKLQKCS